MDLVVLKEKLQKLQGTQNKINTTADYLISRGSDARPIVATWNEAFANATVEQKLTLLHLANDVLQRSKNENFYPFFIHYLPKATAHLYKHGDVKIRSSVERLVNIWSERKVLKKTGMEAVRSQLGKVKGVMTRTEETWNSENVLGQNKRKRGMSSIADNLEEVTEAAKKRTEIEEAMTQLMQERKMPSLARDELSRMKELCDQHYGFVKFEIQRRKESIGALKSIVSEQEEQLEKSKEGMRLCLVKQNAVNEAMGAGEESSDCRESLSLSESNPEMTLLQPDDSPSTMNPGGAFAYSTVPIIPHGYQSFDPYVALPQAQTNIPTGFQMLPANDHLDKTPLPEMTMPFAPNPPYMRQTYMPDDRQGPPVGSYEAHMLHGMHSPYNHPMNFGGYPGQYKTEKHW